MDNYRKIYTDTYGPLPYDDNGRIYEIHHIDGNHSNNSIENLKAVTIDEHYAIHYAQKDWGACQAMAVRMNLSPKIISELARLEAKRRVKAGTHHMLGGELQKRRIADGSHNWISEKHKENMRKSNAERISKGTHNLLGGVTCRTKDGKIVQIEREVYYSQIGEPFEWEYVTVHSKEGKKRKREAGID